MIIKECQRIKNLERLVPAKCSATFSQAGRKYIKLTAPVEKLTEYVNDAITRQTVAKNEDRTLKALDLDIL